MYGEHPAINLDDSKQLDENNENKVNDWEGNVYSYHFVDKDQETQQAVQKINQKPKGSYEAWAIEEFLDFIDLSDSVFGIRKLHFCPFF